MAFASFLTPLLSTDTRALAAAADLALALDAHLDILALGVDRTQIGYSYLGTVPVLIDVIAERAAKDARLAEKAAENALAAQPPGLRSAIETAVTQFGALTDLVASRARYADLVVLPLPYGKTRGVEDQAVIEAALFDGMAPVLVVPDKGLTTARPKRILLAWNQSREAMTATRRALPFLKQADSVRIVVIDPPVHGAERSDPGGQLCQMLVRHGVKAEVQVMARTLPRVSDVLARAARDGNADLIVMGAYGHSRFREAILGGATRDILAETEVPVLMAH